MRRLLLALLLISPLAACTALPTPRQSDERDEDLSEMKRRVIEMQQQMAVNEVEVARLKDRLAELEGRPMSRRSTGESVSPPLQPRPEPRDEENLGAATDEPGAASEDSPPQGVTEEDFEVAPVAVEPGPVPPPPTPLPGEPEEAPTTPLPREREEAPPSAPPTVAGGAYQPVSPEARALYDEGFTHFHEERYVDAETTFQRYLQQFPRTELADNASFWIGEARLQRQDVRGALSAFRQTVERYPEGNKIPDALLKAGECLDSMGDMESARLSYQEIVERFPNTAASEVARARMERLTSR